VALVARSRRDLLLRVHGYRLRRDDLEDCYSQAILELVAYARRGGAFTNRRHLANAIEQRFVSRIHDRRRALSGRSPMQAAMEGAAPLDGLDGEGVQIADRIDVERLVIARQELRLVSSLARGLTAEQRLVLGCQVSLQMDSGEFCRIHGWSAEKYRKVAQRARARLRHLVELSESDVPPLRCASEQSAGTNPVIAGLRLDTSYNGTDLGPNRGEGGPRWRIFNEIPTWAHWSVRHPPGL
jgi:DNA-directed RNA polymerase specialized sigma24 family protein